MTWNWQKQWCSKLGHYCFCRPSGQFIVPTSSHLYSFPPPHPHHCPCSSLSNYRSSKQTCFSKYKKEFLAGANILEKSTNKSIVIKNTIIHWEMILFSPQVADLLLSTNMAMYFKGFDLEDSQQPQFSSSTNSLPSSSSTPSSCTASDLDSSSADQGLGTPPPHFAHFGGTFQ